MKNRDVYNEWRAKIWNAVVARVPGFGMRRSGSAMGKIFSFQEKA